MWKKNKYLRLKLRQLSLLWSLLVVISLICFVILVASIGFRLSQSHTKELLEAGNLWALIVLPAGIFLGIGISQIHRYGWRELFRIIEPAWTLRFIMFSLVVVGAIIFALVISAKFNPRISESIFIRRFVYATIREPGGIFALGTGLATLLALGLTLRSLMEMRSTITSFSDLIDRLCEMLDRASGSDPVQMVCYTPALGYLALPKRDFRKFHQSMVTPDGDTPRAEIICLGPKELSEWHHLFIGRRALRNQIVDEVMVKEADECAKRMITSLCGDENPAFCKNNEIKVKYLPFQFMPGFYFFFTRKQAIIVAPFFLQYPKGAPKPINKDVRQVEMLGFQTSDRGIIDTLRNMYERYKNLPSSLIGEASEFMEVHELAHLQATDFLALDVNVQTSNLAHALIKAGRMLAQLETDLQKAKTGEYADLLKTESNKVEMNFRLLYVNDEQQKTIGGSP